MSRVRRFLKRLAASTLRRDDERLREELATHLAMQTADNIRAGLHPDDARRQAMAKLGSVTAVRDAYRDVQHFAALTDLAHDIRYAWRLLRKAPLFTVAAAASLAVGIGVNTAVFTVVERILLRPLPLVHPEELFYLTDERILTEPSPRFSYPFYRIVAESHLMNGIAAHAAVSLNAAASGQPSRVAGELVSGNYFHVLGATARLGRPLSPEDDASAAANAVAVVSDRFWRRTFGADPNVVGRSVLLNGHPFTVVGVAESGFTGTDVGAPPDLWIPLATQHHVGKDLVTDTRTNWLEIFGRLTAGSPREETARELSAFVESRSPQMSRRHSRRMLLEPVDRYNTPIRRELRPALLVLIALTALAMALACVNVASLAAVRAARRQKEIAIRLALGARRSRVARQLLTEACVLSALGGSIGLLIAPWVARLIITSQPRILDVDTSVDWRVLTFGLAASAVAALMVAITPTLESTRIGLMHLAAGATRGGRTMRANAQDLIVMSQIALALAMLITAALLIQSLRGLKTVDPGFSAGNLLLASLDPAAAGYDQARVDGFWRTALERVRSIPGVSSVSLAGTVPLAPTRQRQPWRNPVSGESGEIDTNFVGPAYFRTLGTPLVRGRDFGDEDRRTSRLVVVVNERLAALFWPGQDAVGKTVRLPDLGNPQAEVVGIVRDVKYRDLRGEAGPMFYRPLQQTRSTDAMTLHVRVSGEPRELMNAVSVALQNIDSNVPVFRMTTLEAQLEASFAQTRQAAWLSGLFGVLALFLSGVGVYGVMALAIGRRTHEIGIRMALGAAPRKIVRTIGARAVIVVLAGLVLGLAVSFAFTHVADSLLFGVTAADTGTFAGMATLLGAVALVALSLPIRSAIRLDVVATIRRE